MKKRLWTVCLAVVTALCLCLGLTACGGDGEPQKTALNAPAGVEVEGDTLSWDAVEGATAGYTVKIGSDETTKVTSGTSLDLTTVTAKLTEGTNTLAVKANATAENLESVYSQSVTYTYTPAPQKTALNAPTGVEVEGDILSWDAVEGATAGYTVKIGSDETTKVASGTSLDLTTVTAKLTEGTNILAVKANETAENLESEYSATVTYSYTPSVDNAVNTYVSRVEAIDVANFSANSTKDDADTIATAIQAAETAYDALDAFTGAKELPAVIQAKASFDTKEETYNSVMTAANGLVSTYKTKVEAAMDIIEAAESYTALTEAQEEAETAYTAVQASNLAKSLAAAVTDLDTDYASIAATVTAWETKINEEAAELTVTTELDSGDDDTAEQIIAEVKEILAADEDLPAYVTSATEYTTAKSTLESKKSEAETQLNATVSQLETDITAAVQNSEATEANYNALKALQDRADALGDYAKDKFETGGKDEDLASALENMLAKVFEIKTTETILYNNNGKDTDKPTLVIVRKYLNVAGEGFKQAENPAVTANEAVTESGVAGAETEITGITVTYDDVNALYIITIPFTRLDYKEGAGTDSLVLKYTIDKEIGDQKVDKELKLSSPHAIVYFDNSTHAAFGTDGNLQVYGNDNETVNVYVYAQDDLEVGTGNEDFKIKNLPLVTGTSATLKTKDALRSALAKAGYTGTQAVYLFAQLDKDVDGVHKISAANSASVSALVTLEDIEESEAHMRLPQLGTGTLVTDKGGITVVIADLEALAAAFSDESVTTDTLYQQVRYHVYVTHKGETKDFYVPYPQGGDISIDANTMKFNIWKLFQDDESNDYAVDIALDLVEGSAYSDVLRESLGLPAGENTPRKWEFTVSEDDAKLQFNPATDANTPWNLGGTPGTGSIVYRWEAATVDAQGFHDGLLIKIYNANDIEDVDAHDFTADEPFAIHTHNQFSAINWTDIIETLRKAWFNDCKAKIQAGEEENIVHEYKFVFAMQIVPNEAGTAQGYIASDLIFATKRQGDDDVYKRETWGHTFLDSEIKAPSEAQFSFLQSDYLGIARDPDNSIGGAGAVFSKYGAQYIILDISDGEGITHEVYFYYDGTTVYLFTDKNFTETESRHDVGNGSNVADLYITANDNFNSIVAAAFSDMSDFKVDDSKWQYRTKVVMPENGNYLDGDWSERFSFVQWNS